jgi:hypothetical protein
MINGCLADSPYADYLQDTQIRLASATAMLSKPFIWNSEPEFAYATLGIEDAMFSVA